MNMEAQPPGAQSRSDRRIQASPDCVLPGAVGGLAATAEHRLSPVIARPLLPASPRQAGWVVVLYGTPARGPWGPPRTASAGSDRCTRGYTGPAD